MSEQQSEQLEVKTFSSRMKTLSFKMDDQLHTIIELDGKQRGEYLNSVSSRVIIGPEGKPVGMKSFDGLETSLLKHCVRDANGQLVPAATMMGWPSSVLAELFDDAMNLSGLNEAARKKLTKEAKND